MVANVSFTVEMSSGLCWYFVVNNGWIVVHAVFDRDLRCAVLSQSFSSACDWIRSLVHLAIRTGVKHMHLQTATGNICIGNGRIYKYTFRESRGFFYE